MNLTRLCSHFLPRFTPNGTCDQLHPVSPPSGSSPTRFLLRPSLFTFRTLAAPRQFADTLCHRHRLIQPYLNFRSLPERLPPAPQLPPCHSSAPAVGSRGAETQPPGAARTRPGREASLTDGKRRAQDVTARMDTEDGTAHTDGTAATTAVRLAATLPRAGAARGTAGTRRRAPACGGDPAPRGEMLGDECQEPDESLQQLEPPVRDGRGLEG